MNHVIDEWTINDAEYIKEHCELQFELQGIYSRRMFHKYGIAPKNLSILEMEKKELLTTLLILGGTASLKKQPTRLYLTVQRTFVPRDFDPDNKFDTQLISKN